MNYIYHRVPDNLKGDSLYPLNTIKNIYPDIYANEVSKYAGREHVKEQRIPLFDNALWNDVLFFVAIEPSKIYKARREAGWPDLKPQKYFKINPRKLDQSKLGIFLFQTNADPEHYTHDNFIDYSHELLNQIIEVPNSTKEYFKNEFKAGESHIKLFYRYIPHVLYHGEINILDAEVITVM
jgi:hypothetical protein